MEFPLTTFVELSFKGRVIEAEFGDGMFYSKFPLAESSTLFLDPRHEIEYFYSTDPVKMIKEVGEFSIRFLREEA
ncbi:hypothetical protein GO755_26355 [Spirosoma sp. HMF4905]|uniref:Uncharacterized protein n=1 Tax=Spirosoma arboris TaxID=2682092 RepID=A0A7K1SIN4_9BACT|nr:hypothetical protein [Spirosoma arboris]MVM33588.1 hypothetical protein [Spirosoma arboris]